MLEQAKIDLKVQLDGQSEQVKAKKIAESVKAQIKRIGDAKNDALVAKYVDRVELGKQGYKQRYYSNKFFVHTNEEQEQFQ